MNIADAISYVLDASGAQATLVGRDMVNGADTYHLALTAPVATFNRELGAIAGSTAGGLTIDTATVDYWVSVDLVRPARIELKGGSSSLGSIDVTLTLMKYNEPVTINAPPASQVQAG